MQASDIRGKVIAATISGIFVVVAAIISGFFLLESSRIKESGSATGTAIAQITQPSFPTLTPASTFTPFATSTPYSTQTPYPTSVIPTPLPATSTPIGMTNQAVQVNGTTAMGWPFQTGIYIQAGDRVQINYISGQWYIGQNINGDWTSQTPTDANGYTGRDGDRVASLLIDAIRTDPNACRPLLSAPFGSLIGRISETGGLFYIGNSYDSTAQYSGVLYLLINYWDHNKVIDCPYGDGGEISVRVNITPH